DEDSIGNLKPGDPADDVVKSKKIDAEMAVIVQANAIWALYDTDNDSKFDLAFTSTNGADPTMLMVTNAWKLNGPKEMTPAPEHIGRKLLRPGLISFPRAATAVRILMADTATDEGLGSLPATGGIRYRFRAKEMKGVLANTAVEAFSGTTSVLLVDVDH